MAYITHGDRLLVFRQPDFPEAGVQVPGGSVVDDEELEEAVLREAYEETGIDSLTVARYLGDTTFDLTIFGREELHHRHYFHLRVADPVAETWDHYETDPSEGDHERILFRFEWVQFPDRVPTLIARMDELLYRLTVD